MYEVKNGNRILRFEGRHLAHSSSQRYGASRWIEFDLYKTAGGKYVLSRVGVSHIFHSSTCPMVSRYALHEARNEDLGPLAVPCPECAAERSDPILFPEAFRHWTLVSDDAEAVLEALYRPDDNGSLYLTQVAERLLQEAAAQDAEMDLAYRFEFID